MSSTGSGKDNPPGPDRYPGPMVYAGIGMLNAICLILGGALGWLADRALGTLPLFMLIGLLAGAGLGVIATRAELRRYGRQG
jgi:F0F1-type ATP synthase assembly protein I